MRGNPPFETLDLGDARLNRRAVLLAERLALKPGASIPNACHNWSETVDVDARPEQSSRKCVSSG